MRSLILSIALCLLPGAADAITPMSSADLMKTRAERTRFVETDNAEITFDLLARIAERSPDIRLETFGLTPEGRELKVVVAAQGADDSTLDAHRDKIRVLLIAGIHAGEIEGKDAGAMLLRDLTNGEGARWPHEHVLFAFVPIFNLDGHERPSPHNRINQNGPRNMGWRGTSQRYNLNRDFLKADSDEMRALLGLWNRLDPHLLLDSHTTDGADYQYDLTWHLERFDLIDPNLRAWQEAFFIKQVFPATEKRGHLLSAYPEPLDHRDLTKGVSYFISTPRFSTGYGTARNRPVLLIETHMLKDYGTRVRATYDLLAETLAHLQKDGDRLSTAVAKAEAATASAGSLVLATKPSGKLDRLPFKGFAFSQQQSEISGDLWVRYDPDKPTDFELPYLFEQIPAVTVERAAAYVIPPAYAHLAAHLDRHGIRYRRLPFDLDSTATATRINNPVWADKPFEGRLMLREFQSTQTDLHMELKAGSLIVDGAQANGRILAHLLEPEGPDSLLRWGEFNIIFEQREYAEPRVAEALARELSASRPELRAEFEAKLKAEPAFAKDAWARLNWWFMRSDYRERDLGLYPILRLDQAAFARIDRLLGNDQAGLTR